MYSEYIEEDDGKEYIADGAGDEAEAGEDEEDDNTGDFDFSEKGFGTGPIGRGGINSLKKISF